MTDKKPVTSDNTELADQLEELTGYKKGKPIVIPLSANIKITNVIGVSASKAATSFEG